MAVGDKARAALQEIEAELAEPTKGGVDSLNLTDRIRAVRKLLAKEEPQWIGVREAQRLLAASSEDVVKAWVRMGFLRRSRVLDDGSMQLLLDDVLQERETREDLLAIGGDDLTEEQLEVMYQARPGTAPWERGLKADLNQ